jgi:hypothetical protein
MFKFNGTWYKDTLMCPITLTEIKLIGCTDNGSLYEFSAIKDWLTNHNTDPATGIELPCRHVWYLGELKNGPSRTIIMMKAQDQANYLREAPLRCRYAGAHNCQEITI